MRTFKKFAPVLLTAVFVFLPLLTLAEGPLQTGPGGSTGYTTDTGGSTGLQTAPGGSTGYPTAPGGSTGYQTNAGQYSIKNPLSVNNFCDLIKKVLEALMIIGLPVAVLFLVWVGFKFILAQGNPGELQTARKNLFHTVIGIAIFLGAWTIAQIIANTLRELGVSGFGSC